MSSGEGKTTLVCYHDLLGYGGMIAVSGGTLDSKVGAVALQRIRMLQKTMTEVKDAFPSDTTFYQLNDCAVAVCDVDIKIVGSHVEEVAHTINLLRNPSLKVLKFICGSAKLHKRTWANEEREKIGPAGRTFIVLGKRWEINEADSGINTALELQANLAFAEAYLADSGGKGKFNKPTNENIYINDKLKIVINVLNQPNTLTDPIENLKRLNFPIREILDIRDKNFPGYIINDDNNKIDLTIFERKRSFYSIMSDRAVTINDVLSEIIKT